MSLLVFVKQVVVVEGEPFVVLYGRNKYFPIGSFSEVVALPFSSSWLDLLKPGD